MAKLQRRLGRGLDSLVSGVELVPRETDFPAPDTSYNSSRYTDEKEVLAFLVGVGRLRPNPLQPRGPIDLKEVKELSDSLRRHGVLQPISVRRAGEGFEIIAGERRWRAAQLAGLAEVPVVVREANDEQMLELALIENLQREDLNAIDRGRAYRLFCERFGLSAEQVALRAGEDRSTVANYLRLLELPESVQALVASKKLGMAHARMILSEPNASLRAKLGELAVSRELTVKGIEEVIRKGKEIAEGGDGALAGKQPVAPDRLRSAHLRDMEQKFERALKTRVNIKEGRKKGSGKIVIDFFTLDDFDRVAERLGVAPD